MKEGHTIPVLGNGFVRYIRHVGTDTDIVGAARVSYDSPSKGPDEDRKLLEYLYKNRHTSPFEQVNISFEIKMPIFVMRQFVRHRTFRLNEMSARYTELPSDFYLPDTYRAQDTKNKQGSVEAKELDHAEICTMVRYHSMSAYRLYQGLIAKGVAREMARMVLPVNIYTKIQVNIDLHNLFHFLRLRLDSHAQSEIRDVAAAMKTIAAEFFPWSVSIFERTKVNVTVLEEKTV